MFVCASTCQVFVFDTVTVWGCTLHVLLHQLLYTRTGFVSDEMSAKPKFLSGSRQHPVVYSTADVERS